MSSRWKWPRPPKGRERNNIPLSRSGTSPPASASSRPGQSTPRGRHSFAQRVRWSGTIQPPMNPDKRRWKNNTNYPRSFRVYRRPICLFPQPARRETIRPLNWCALRWSSILAIRGVCSRSSIDDFSPQGGRGGVSARTGSTTPARSPYTLRANGAIQLATNAASTAGPIPTARAYLISRIDGDSGPDRRFQSFLAAPC